MGASQGSQNGSIDSCCSCARRSNDAPSVEYSADLDFYAAHGTATACSRGSQSKDVSSPWCNAASGCTKGSMWSQSLSVECVPHQTGDPKFGDEKCTKSFSINTRLSEVLQELSAIRRHETSQHEMAWFQFAADHIWPFVETAVSNLVIRDVNQQLERDCAGIPLMDTFKFEKCEFGGAKPTFGPLVARAQDDTVELMIDMNWKADGSEIQASVGGFSIGMKDIRLSGTILLVFCPLVPVLPITGGLSITFPDPPDLDWTWTGLGKAFDVELIRSHIIRALFQTIVTPSSIFVDIADPADLGDLVRYKSPQPVGVLCIAALQARGLCSENSYFNPTTDPYIVIRVGSGEYTTCTMRKTVNPEWGEFHAGYFIVYQLGQRVFVDLYDASQLTADRCIGSLTISEEGGNKGAVDMRCRPTVHEFVQKHKKWWHLDTPSGSLAKDRRTEVQLLCSFYNIGDDDSDERPSQIDCPGRCGLVPLEAKEWWISAKCAICRTLVLQSWEEWMASKPCATGMGCLSCRFAVCLSCWKKCRPPLGLLRIVIKCGRVPVSDAAQGAVLSVEYEGTTFCSQPSCLPIEDTLSVKEAKLASAVHNLRGRAKLDVTTIGTCLNLPIEKVNQILEEECNSKENRLEQFASEDEDRKTVIWQEAFCFLVKQQSSRDFVANVCYTVGGGLSVLRKLSSQRHLDVTMGARSRHATWVLSGDGGCVEIDTEISLQPLTKDQLHHKQF